MTLTELAYRLKEIFPQTKYITVGSNPHASIVGDRVVSIFYERKGQESKPEYNKNSIYSDTWGIKHHKLKVNEKPFYIPGIHQFYLHEISNLDLSEYADENGNIDYSKCIVEMK